MEINKNSLLTNDYLNFSLPDRSPLTNKSMFSTDKSFRGRNGHKKNCFEKIKSFVLSRNKLSLDLSMRVFILISFLSGSHASSWNIFTASWKVRHNCSEKQAIFQADNWSLWQARGRRADYLTLNFHLTF